MKPIKVAEGKFWRNKDEYHYFRVYLSDNPTDVAKEEGVHKALVHLAGNIPSMNCNIYLIHSIQVSL